MIPDAVKLDGHPVGWVREVDLSKERSGAVTDPVLEARTAEFSSNQQVLDHPTPFAERDGIVTQTVVKH